jgi:hypothetical protein
MKVFKGFVVISYNLNPDYIYFAPLTMWAWKKLGWEPVLMWVDGHGISEFNKLVENYSPQFIPIKISPIPEYRSATVAQISRLYASCLLDGLTMTADVDMIPLSDYWNPGQKEKTVYGFDLTGHKEFPICYISMPSDQWHEVMSINYGGIDAYIKRDLDSMPNAKSDDFYEWWGVDQQLITHRLKPFNPILINRGQYSNGYARGRVDRGSWSLNHSEFIDCHMFQQLYHKGREDKFDKTMELLTSIWPDEDFGWFLLYTEKFRNLCGNP